MFEIGLVIKKIEELSHGKLTSRCLNGAQSKSVVSFAPLEKASEEHVAFLAQSKFAQAAKDCKAGVLVLNDKDYEVMYPEGTERALVITANPYAWFAYALQVATQKKPQAGRIDPKAFVAKTATVAPTAIVEAGAFVGENATVGDRTHLYPGAYVGDRVRVGGDCIFYANVSVYHDCLIGNRVILHSGCVIGADGFGFAPMAGEWVKIPQIGAVEIGDDVEVGASTTIDRGALQNTIVGKGAKLDNQIQLGHNVVLGEHSLMCACTGVAGSTKIGAHVVIGGGCNINGHITIPDQVQIGPATSVLQWEKGAKAMMGWFPAQEVHQFERTAVLIRRLGKLRETIKKMQEEIDLLKNRTL